MLRSWLEHVRLSIHPDGLDGVVIRRGDGKILRRERLSIPMASPHEQWESHLAMLPEFLSALKVQNRETRVILSNALVHFLVHPWQEALGGSEEWLAFSQHAYTSLYGQDAETWRIRLAMQGYGKPAIACAMENTLAEGIASALAKAGARVSGIEPYFNACFNRYRKQLQGDESWLAQLEPSRLSLARIREGSLVQMVTRRMDASSEESPELVLKRELERCTDGNPNATLFFHVAGNISVPEGLMRNVSVLGRNQTPLSDAGLAIALC